MSPPMSPDDRARAIEEWILDQRDPRNKPASSLEVAQVRREVTELKMSFETKYDAHREDDERSFKALGDRIDVFGSTVNAMGKDVEALKQRRQSPFPGSYASVRSVMPPPGKPTDTGSFNVKQDYLEDIQRQIGELHDAREAAEKTAALATARAEGAEAEKRAQARAAAEAKTAALEKEAAEERVAASRIRNLKLVLAILGTMVILGPALAWCASEARHAATDIAIPKTTHYTNP